MWKVACLCSVDQRWMIEQLVLHSSLMIFFTRWFLGKSRWRWCWSHEDNISNRQSSEKQTKTILALNVLNQMTNCSVLYKEWSLNITSSMNDNTIVACLFTCFSKSGTNWILEWMASGKTSVKMKTPLCWEHHFQGSRVQNCKEMLQWLHIVWSWVRVIGVGVRGGRPPPVGW